MSAVYDHLGNKFPSTYAMLEHYDISRYLYHKKLKEGTPLNEILTEHKKISDHLGNKYKTINEMCTQYEMDPVVYHRRIQLGWSIKKALTTPYRKRNYCSADQYVDHLGNTYSSVAEMCEAYHIPESIFRSRMALKWPLSQALLRPPIDHSITDHVGNKFSSMEAMAVHYGLTRRIVDYRLKHGWPLEETLTTPMRTKRKIDMITDHLGNGFNSINQMCLHYNIQPHVYKSRISTGMTMEEALTAPSSAVVDTLRRTDHYGIVYESRKAMLAHYGVSLTQFKYRLDKGLSLQQALEL